DDVLVLLDVFEYLHFHEGEVLLWRVFGSGEYGGYCSSYLVGLVGFHVDQALFDSSYQICEAYLLRCWYEV
ncbi:hypothetical protein M513_14331, partial [Trichuris suis]